MKRYCTKCGVELIRAEDTRKNWVKYKLPNYDELTRKPIDYSGVSYECANNSFWNDHDNYFIQNHKLTSQ